MIRARTLTMTLAAALVAAWIPVSRADDPAAAAPAAQPEAAVAPAAQPEAAVPAPAAAPEVAPAPAEVKVTEATPVGEEKAERVGASTCLACHPAKEAFHENIHAKVWPIEKKIEFEAACETCHGPGSLHAAAAGDRSNPGFATIRGPSELKSAKGAETCLQCHEGGKRIHWEGSVHESRDVGCASCHAVHAGRKKLLLADTEIDTCTKCHQNMKAEFRRMSHHPVGEGKITCTDCHNPHGTVGPKLLAANSVNDTCFKCHAEKRGPMLWEHRPVAESCLNCHMPHGSTHNKLMRQRLPYLCQSCHGTNSRHPGTIYAVNPTVYGANSPEQVLNTRTLYRACVNCHQQIHGSNHPSGKTFTR